MVRLFCVAVVFVLPLSAFSGGYPPNSEYSDTNALQDAFSEALNSTAPDKGPIVLRPGNGPDLAANSGANPSSSSAYQKELEALNLAKQALDDRERALEEREASQERERASSNALMKEKMALSGAQIENAEKTARAQRIKTIMDPVALMTEQIRVNFLEGATLEVIVRSIMPPEWDVYVDYDLEHKHLHDKIFQYAATASRQMCLSGLRKEAVRGGDRVFLEPVMDMTDELGNPAPLIIISARK